MFTTLGLTHKYPLIYAVNHQSHPLPYGKPGRQLDEQHEGRLEEASEGLRKIGELDHSHRQGKVYECSGGLRITVEPDLRSKAKSILTSNED
jgi:hypothetical protein